MVLTRSATAAACGVVDVTRFLAAVTCEPGEQFGFGVRLGFGGEWDAVAVAFGDSAAWRLVAYSQAS